MLSQTARFHYFFRLSNILLNMCVCVCVLAQTVKNLPAMQETQVQSLGWEDPVEKGKASHSSVLVWRFPWSVRSMRSQRTVIKAVSKKKKKRETVQSGLRLGPLTSKPILLDTAWGRRPLEISGALGLWGGRGAARLGWFLALPSLPRGQWSQEHPRALQRAGARGRGSLLQP